MPRRRREGPLIRELAGGVVVEVLAAPRGKYTCLVWRGTHATRAVAPAGTSTKAEALDWLRTLPELPQEDCHGG